MNEQYSVDLDLWRVAKTASTEDNWKWDWNTWEPTIDAIYWGTAKLRIENVGRFDFEDLICPVCKANEVYAYFLTVDIVLNNATQTDKRTYVADRWFGCHNCQTQMRDRGQLPNWISEEAVVWASPGLKGRAESKLMGKS